MENFVNFCFGWRIAHSSVGYLKKSVAMSLLSDISVKLKPSPRVVYRYINLCNFFSPKKCEPHGFKTLKRWS